MDARIKRPRVGWSDAENLPPEGEWVQGTGASVSQSSSVGLFDLPSAILNLIVKSLSYGSLPQLRLASKLAMEVVDSASDGWLLKPSELQLLKKSDLLNKLKNLQYMWLEDWNLERYDADLVDFLHDQRVACARLREVRFHRTVPGTGLTPYSCALLCHTCTSLTGLCLAPLSSDAPADGVALAARALTCLTALTDLSLEGWIHTDQSIKWVAKLGGLKKLSAGSFSNLTEVGYRQLSGLTALSALWCHEVSGTAETVTGLSGLTNLRFLRAELSDKFADPSLGVLAKLPHLRTLGWWHRQTIPPESMAPLALLAKEQAALSSPCAVGSQGSGEGSETCGLQEISLCIDLDPGSLRVVSLFPKLRLLQVMSLDLSRLPVLHHCRLTSLTTLVLGCLTPDSLPVGHAGLGEIFPCLENLLLFNVAGDALSLLSQLKSLRRLALHTERLTDEQLLELPSLPSVCSLQLEGCKRVTVRGITSVAAALQPSRLLLVDMHSFGDVCVRALMQHMPSLESLSLCSLPALSDAGVGLLPLLPNLKELQLLKLIRVSSACLPSLTGSGPAPVWNQLAAEVAEDVTPSLVEMLMPLANQPNHWDNLAGVIDIAAQHAAEGWPAAAAAAAAAAENANEAGDVAFAEGMHALQEEGEGGEGAAGAAADVPAPAAGALANYIGNEIGQAVLADGADAGDAAPADVPAPLHAAGAEGGLPPLAPPPLQPLGPPLVAPIIAPLIDMNVAAVLQGLNVNVGVQVINMGMLPVGNPVAQQHQAAGANNGPQALIAGPGGQQPALQPASHAAPSVGTAQGAEGASEGWEGHGGDPLHAAPSGTADSSCSNGTPNAYMPPYSALSDITISQCPRISRADCMAAVRSARRIWQDLVAATPGVRPPRELVSVEWDDVVAANPTLLDEYAFPT